MILPAPIVVAHAKENEEGEEQIASPFFASGWAAFDDDNNDDAQGARKIGALTDDPVLALDEGPVVGASSFSAPAAPSSLTTTHQKSVDTKRDVMAGDDDDDDGTSAIEEGREIGEVLIRRIERRQLRLGKMGVQSSPPPATTYIAFSSTTMSGTEATADVNTTMDTAAAVAPTSLSMRIIKESLTKKKKKNIRGTSNNSSHSGSSG